MPQEHPPVAGPSLASPDAPDCPEDVRGADGMLIRTARIAIDAERLSARAEGDERIPVAFSSEQPVLRYDVMEGERYYEVLDHSPESVDLSYARDGMPFLLDHRLTEQVGIVEDVTIDGDRRARGMIRFSRSARAQEIRQDILDGIRKKVSFGYRVGNDYQQTDAPDGGVPTRRYTRWTPMEVSSVAVPADYSVGYGRSAQAPRHPAPTTPRKGKETAMPEQAPGAAPTGAPAVTETRDLRAEYQKIRAMCRKFHIDAATEDGFLARGLTPDQVAREILDAANARIDQLAATPPAPVLDISPKERREFSLGRALKAMHDNDWSQAGYEREVSSALAKRLERNTTGVLVPTDALGGWSGRTAREVADLRLRTPLTAGGATTGADTVFTEPGAFIELLRNKSAVLNRGIVFLSGLRGNLALPRQTGAGTAAFSAENPGADYTESNITFDQVQLSPKTIAATQAYSKQLFVQSIVSIDALVREDISAIIALLYDKNALHGDGTGNGITGIYSLSGVNSVAMGGAITFAKVVDMESAVEAANAALGNFAYVTTPEIKGKAKQTLDFAASAAGRPIWTGPADAGEMNGYTAVASNQVAKNLGVGANEHGIVFGAWNQAIGADWGAVEFIVDPYTRARQSLVNITATWLVDFNLRHGPAFTKGTGLTVA